MFFGRKKGIFELCVYVHNPKLHALNYFSNCVLLEGFCLSETVVWESLYQLKVKVGTDNSEGEECYLHSGMANTYRWVSRGT